MSAKTLVFCVEERSARLMLEGVLPRILPEEVDCQFIVFEGKQDLLKRVGMRIQGWRTPNSKFLVLCDQDAEDCRCLKSRILSEIKRLGKPNKIRIACHELENFYLGDLKAVENGLRCRDLSRLSGKATYRNPDVMTNAPDQLKRITSNAYQKCDGSRSIAPFLDVSGGSRSCSFNALLSAVRELIGD